MTTPVPDGTQVTGPDAGPPPPVPPEAPYGAPPPGQNPPPGQAPPPAWAPGPTPGPAALPNRAQPALVGGVILVVVGAAVLVGRVIELNLAAATWPLWIVVPGVAMLVGSFFIPPRGGLGLAIPGAIVMMVGLVLWVQEAYGLYATWAYAWALVAPTGPGLGMLLYGLVHRDHELAADGLRTTLVGLGLFVGFAIFFEGVIGLSGDPIGNLDEILPYAAIGLGLLLVVLSFVGGRRRERRT